MKKNYKKGQQVYRFLPCPSYDISGVENWLADMAVEGLLLKSDGIFAGIAAFEYDKPQKISYRLEAAQKNTSMWADDGGEPDPEQVELGKKYSWEYVAKLKDFYIYRSADPLAREMNTDPQVQALALNAVKKRKREAVISSVLLLIIYPVILTRGCLLLTAISLGSWWMALVLVLIALMLADDIRAFVHLKKVQKSLLCDGYYSQEKPWRKTSGPYLFRKLAKTVLAAILILAFLRVWGASITDDNKVPLKDYSGDIPFATLTDFAGEGWSDYEPTMTGLSKRFDTIETRNDWLAPVSIEFNEHAKIKRADGSFLDGGLYIDYCELRSPALAKLLVSELCRLDKMKKGFEPIDAPALDADEVIAYTNDLHWPTVIIRKGSIVMKAYFFQTSQTYTIPLSEWSGILCESIGE